MATAEEAFTLLGEAFGVRLSPARMAAWRDACRDMHPDDLALAVRELIQQSERMPNVAQVRKAVMDLPERHEVHSDRPKRRYQVVCNHCAERYETNHVGENYHACDPSWLEYFAVNPHERQARGMASILGKPWQPAAGS